MTKNLSTDFDAFVDSRVDLVQIHNERLEEISKHADNKELTIADYIAFNECFDDAFDEALRESYKQGFKDALNLMKGGE